MNIKKESSKLMALSIVAILMSACASTSVVSEVSSRFDKSFDSEGAKVTVLEPVNYQPYTVFKPNNFLASRRGLIETSLKAKLEDVIAEETRMRLVSNAFAADYTVQISYAVSSGLVDEYEYGDDQSDKNRLLRAHSELGQPNLPGFAYDHAGFLAYKGEDDNEYASVNRRIDLVIKELASGQEVYTSRTVSYGTCIDISNIADEMLSALFQGWPERDGFRVVRVKEQSHDADYFDDDEQVFGCNY